MGSTQREMDGAEVRASPVGDRKMKSAVVDETGTRVIDFLDPLSLPAAQIWAWSWSRLHACTRMNIR